MDEENTSFQQSWVILELFGHNMIAGYATEQSIGGAAFVRVDVPEVRGQPGFTKFFSGSAVYAITPTSEEVARKAAANLTVRPVSLWVVPDSRGQLPPPTVESVQVGRCEDRDLG